MSPVDYTEDALVEQPAIALMAELGWETVNAYAELDPAPRHSGPLKPTSAALDSGGDSGSSQEDNGGAALKDADVAQG